MRSARAGARPAASRIASRRYRQRTDRWPSLGRVAQDERRHPHVAHSNDTLVAMLAPVALPASIERVERGHSSTNYRVEIRDSTRLHLRLDPAGQRVAAKEVAVQRLVSTTVPVPRVLHEAANAAHPYYVARWIDDAMPLDRVLGEEQLDDATGLGAVVGRTLAAIHQYTFDRAGDFEGFLFGYRSNAPWVTPDWLRRARFLDLSSQLENLGSAQEKPVGHRVARALVADFRKA